MKKEVQTSGRSITSDVEKESVLRTKRAKRCRSVLFQRSSTRRFACFPSDRRMLLLRDNGLIRCPEIGEAVTSAVRKWNGPPQTATSGLASISNGVSNHLTSLAAQRNPDPRLVRLFRDKEPELIQF